MDDISGTLPDYAALTLPPPPEGRPYVLVNMVTSTDGKITIEGSERGLGSPADQQLMRMLRANVDAVLNGATTLRASGSSPSVDDPSLVALREARGLSAAPLGVVLTSSGDLPLEDTFFTSPDFEAIVVATDRTPSADLDRLRSSGRTVEVVPSTDVGPGLMRLLRQQYGVRSVLCEGGATVNGLLFDAGLVDELFLTLAPRVVGGDGVLTPVRAGRPPSFAETWRLELLSTFPNDATGEVYLRYRVADRGIDA